MLWTMLSAVVLGSSFAAHAAPATQDNEPVMLSGTCDYAGMGRLRPKEHRIRCNGVMIRNDPVRKIFAFQFADSTAGRDNPTSFSGPYSGGREYPVERVATADGKVITVKGFCGLRGLPGGDVKTVYCIAHTPDGTYYEAALFRSDESP